MIKSFSLAALSLAWALAANSIIGPNMNMKMAHAQDAPHEIWHIAAYMVLDEVIKNKRTNGHFVFIDKASCDAFLEMTPQHPAWAADTRDLAIAAVRTFGPEVEIGFQCEKTKEPGEPV